MVLKQSLALVERIAITIENFVRVVRFAIRLVVGSARQREKCKKQSDVETL